jgi:hypothetical protein
MVVSSRRTRLEIIRIAYGAAQIAFPGWIARWTGGQTDTVSLRVRRVLGARHIAQALLLMGNSRRSHELGAVVDGAHAASMIALAIADRRRRRDAVLNAMSTLAFALCEAVG